MRLIPSVFLALLTLIITSAQPTVSGTIVGRITDSKTNDPIEGATVSFDYGRTMTVSDSLGEFRFQDLPATQYCVTAYCPSFVGTLCQTVNVLEDGMEQIDFILKPQTPIPFSDSTGNPLMNSGRQYADNPDYKSGVTIGIEKAKQEIALGAPSFYRGSKPGLGSRYSLTGGLPVRFVHGCVISPAIIGINDGHNWYIQKMKETGALAAFVRTEWEDIIAKPNEVLSISS